MPHAPHVCWHCSCTIFADEPEKQVEGLPRASIRYAHQSEEGCRQAVNRYPIPESYGRDPMTDAEEMWNGKDNLVFLSCFFSVFLLSSDSGQDKTYCTRD